MNRSQPAATRKCTSAYICDGVRNVDSGQTAAIHKCKFAYMCDGVWYNDGGQQDATLERPVANGGDRINLSQIGDKTWDYKVPCCFISIMSLIRFWTCNFRMPIHNIVKQHLATGCYTYIIIR